MRRGIGKQCRRGVVGLLLLIAGIVSPVVCSAATVLAGFSKFDHIFEPSGVQQLPDGRFLVVEDEAAQPVSVFTLGDSGKHQEHALWRRSLSGWMSPNRSLGSLEDLEDVTLDAAGRIYAITSHSHSAGGRRALAREQLVRFSLDGDKVTDLQLMRGLRKAIDSAHDSLRTAARRGALKQDGGFDIEGLSFDRHGQQLLIALRGPVVDGRALIVTLLNPSQVFDDGVEPQIDEQLIGLDLEGGGIRGMAWDEHLGGYLIISRRPEKNFKLWLWDGMPGHAPRRLRVRGIDNLRQAEGVAPVRRHGRPTGIVIVSDEGDGLTGKPGRFVFVSYEEIVFE